MRSSYKYSHFHKNKTKNNEIPENVRKDIEKYGSTKAVRLG